MSDDAQHTLDLDRELLALVAQEEMLAFFDFLLDLGGGRRVEGLCKVSRPRERRSRARYLSLLFVVDAVDAETQQALTRHFAAASWGSAAIAGVEGILPVPHRSAGAGLFLKEVDVYLDGSRDADMSFLRSALLPVVARSAGISPGELTVWEQKAPAAAAAPPAAAESEGIVSRLRRLIGLGPA